MKKLLNLSLLLTLFAFCVSFSGCTKEGHGDFALSIKEVGADYVDIFVTAPSTLEMAYVIATEPQLVTPAVLYKTGTIVTVNPADVIRVRNRNQIMQDTKYYLYAVAKLNEASYSEKISMEFTTKKFNFDELMTLVETYYDGYKVHITIPKETKERGNVIRMGSMPLSWYYMLKSQKGAETVDMQAVASTGDPYSNIIRNDTTIVMDAMNVVLLDENGEPVLDQNGDTYDIHEPMAPGEPTILFAGETRYGSKEEFNDVVGYYQPEGYSWSVPCWDPATGEWYGAFQKKEFFTKEPSLCDATVDIEIPEDEIGITDAMVYFHLSEDAYSCFYMVLDPQTYNQILSTYLNGNEEWWQWFLTSYLAFYEFGVYPQTESFKVNAASSFLEPLTGGQTYHVLATVFGDPDGATQRFVHKEFKAKDKTKVAPNLKVTAVPSSNPYEAVFNIKVGPDSKGDIQPIEGAYWVCNYTRDYELMFNSGYDYPSLLKGLGNTLTPAEVAAVNSEEGLTVSFYTLDGEVTRFAIYGCNDEYTFNPIDEIEYTDGWADYTAPMAESGKVKIDSPLYETLSGDWTATATVRARQKLEDGEVVAYTMEHKSKVSISPETPELPVSLDAGVYDLYPKKTKDEVNGMFEELGERLGTFTEYRLENHNRLICNGFIDLDPTSVMNKFNSLEYRSPYDLFVATDYMSVDVAQIVHDFGPKWYLEVLEDGSVIVPFSASTMPPMVGWTDYKSGYNYYVGGVGDNGIAFYEATDAVPGFPVEISADGSKITIKPIVLTDGTTQSPYYMNALGIATQMSDGSLTLLSTVISDIVLTKGWTEPKSRMSSVEIVPSSVEAVNMDGSPVMELPKPRICKSLTKFEAEPLPEYKFVEKAVVVTKEQVDAANAKIMKYYNLY